jgi:hypothetical protein
MAKQTFKDYQEQNYTVSLISGKVRFTPIKTDEARPAPLDLNELLKAYNKEVKPNTDKLNQGQAVVLGLSMLSENLLSSKNGILKYEKEDFHKLSERTI